MINYSMHRLRGFARQQEGSATIEAMIWIPLFFSMLLLAVDVSLIVASQSIVMRILQDGNRAYAIGLLADDAATRNFIQDAIKPISSRATVTSQVDNMNKVIVSTVTMPASDLGRFGLLPNFASLNVTVSAQQVKEF